MSDRTASEGDEVAATVVVGGGIGGLVAALVAAEGRARVVLVEPHPLGGRARCDERDGYVLNRGPRALYRGGPAEQGLQALGVATHAGGAPAMAGAMALHRGGLERFPSGAIGAARTRLLTTAEKVTVSRALTRPELGRRASGGAAFLTVPQIIIGSACRTGRRPAVIGASSLQATSGASPAPRQTTRFPSR